jgi:hypothetical protein
VTTGARLALPLFRGRFPMSPGGGYGWLRSLEHADSGGAEASCSSCQSVGGKSPMKVGELMSFRGGTLRE